MSCLPQGQGPAIRPGLCPRFSRTPASGPSHQPREHAPDPHESPDRARQGKARDRPCRGNGAEWRDIEPKGLNQFRVEKKQGTLMKQDCLSCCYFLYHAPSFHPAVLRVFPRLGDATTPGDRCCGFSHFCWADRRGSDDRYCPGRSPGPEKVLGHFIICQLPTGLGGFDCHDPSLSGK